jgi:YesN/AraC family two-component response regulator|tara:strand:+ start:4152 stop:5159 length:1008 start_codon:yes stop_codon:yes gene_type:complete
MVSNRCKIAVKEELTKLGLHFSIVGLGEVDVMETISIQHREQLRVGFNNIGLELMDDNRAILIEKIKNIIIEMIHHSEESVKINFSHYLSDKLNHDYPYLSNLFSEVQGTTIEQFLISHKVEKTKELLTYGELSITQIASKLRYSSVAHLSSQFKKVVGISPSQFLKLKKIRRKPIEEIGESLHKTGANSLNDANNKIKLFLVDDDPVSLKLLENQFLDYGSFTLKTFTTGELCIERLFENPDIIILDYHLNSIVKDAMTGLETLDKIKSLNAEIPVIILSSQDKIDVAVDCLHHKAVDYVVKSETAFLRLKKIIAAALSYKKMEMQLNWFEDRM